MATKGQFIRTVAAKAMLFFAINIAVFTALGCVLVVGACASSDLYDRTDEEYFAEADENCLYYSAVQETNYLLSGEEAYMYGMEVEVLDGTGKVIATTGGVDATTPADPEIVHTYAANAIYDSEGNYKGLNSGPIEENDQIVAVTIVAYADPADFQTHSDFDRMAIHGIYTMRYAVFPIAVVCFIAGIACYISLICAAGRKPGTDDVV